MAADNLGIQKNNFAINTWCSVISDSGNGSIESGNTNTITIKCEPHTGNQQRTKQITINPTVTEPSGDTTNNKVVVTQKAKLEFIELINAVGKVDNTDGFTITSEDLFTSEDLSTPYSMRFDIDKLILTFKTNYDLIGLGSITASQSNSNSSLMGIKFYNYKGIDSSNEIEELAQNDQNDEIGMPREEIYLNLGAKNEYYFVVTCSFFSNTDGSQNTITINVKGKDYKFIQAVNANGDIDVSPSTISVEAAGEQKSFTITSNGLNTNYTIEIED